MTVFLTVFVQTFSPCNKINQFFYDDQQKVIMSSIILTMSSQDDMMCQPSVGFGFLTQKLKPSHSNWMEAVGNCFYIDFFVVRTKEIVKWSCTKEGLCTFSKEEGNSLQWSHLLEYGLMRLYDVFSSFLKMQLQG